MFKKEKIIIMFTAVLLLTLATSLAVQAQEDYKGKTYYLATNIFYEKPEVIYSTNYHKGNILALGTKVTVKDVSRKGISFVDENGVKFKIVYVPEHAASNETVWNHFRRYFTSENPTGPDGSLSKCTPEEKENIKIGEIAVGMSRQAILLSWGYPPSHQTPNLKADIWRYWESRFVTQSVRFKDDKAYEIKRGA